MSSFPISAYVELHKLRGGHSDTINCLSFSPNGAYLASGGDDYALVIWNVLQGRQLYRIVFKSGVEYVLWHPTLPDTVIIGCANGSLLQIHEFSLNQSEQYEIHLGARSTVHYLDYDARSGKLAISMGEEVHITRERKPNQYAGDVVLPPPPAPEGIDEQDLRVRAISMRFIEDGEALLVSYTAHGISCWDTATRESRWHISMPTTTPYIGGAAFSPHHRYVAVYNLADGMDLYSLGSQKKAKAKKSYKFETPSRSKHLLRVKYVHRGHGIVSGSTTGKVCIFETATGEICQNLEHGDDIIQAVDSTIQDKLSYVATGTTLCGQKTYIKIWKARITQERGSGDFSESVADFVQSADTRKALLDIGAALLLVALCAGGIWACVQTPWSFLLEASMLLSWRAWAFSSRVAQTAASSCYEGLVTATVYLYAAADALKEHSRQYLRAFLLFVFPEFAAGVGHDFVGPVIDVRGDVMRPIVGVGRDIVGPVHPGL